MSRYGALIAWAKHFGRSDVVSTLEKTLNEKAADAALTSVSEAVVKQRAAA